MSSTKFFSLVLLLPAVVSAVNDWNKPCLNGSCSFDLHNSTSPHGVAGGSVYLDGSNSSISDLTSAAGWHILDCDPSATVQTIRAVCTGSNATCGELYNNGATNTIVRLPEGCGTMPFARVSAESMHEDQSVPDTVAQKLRRRDGQPDSTVRSITLDTNFSAIDASHHGPVKVFLQGASGAAGSAAAVQQPTTRSLHARSIWDDIEDTFDSAVSDIEQTFTYSNTTSIPISESKTFPLWNDTATCAIGKDAPTVSAGAKVGVTAKANATLDYGLVLAGTLVPPEITNFQLLAGLDAKLDGILAFDLFAQVSVTTGKIALFTLGLPGLTFPGIITVGPQFVINADATASIGADADFSVDLSYTASGARFYFPDNGNNSWGTFAPSDTNIAIAANPAVSATGSFAAHLIPTITFGLNALDGLADVNVNINLDAQAGVTAKLSQPFTGNTNFTGCLDVSTGFSVNADADGEFFGFFNHDFSYTLYTKTWDLWKKCFSTDITRREHSRNFPHFPQISKRGVSCPVAAAANGTKITLTNSTIPASTIVANQTSSN